MHTLHIARTLSAVASRAVSYAPIAKLALAFTKSAPTHAASRTKPSCFNSVSSFVAVFIVVVFVVSSVFITALGVGIFFVSVVVVGAFIVSLGTASSSTAS